MQFWQQDLFEPLRSEDAKTRRQMIEAKTELPAIRKFPLGMVCCEDQSFYSVFHQRHMKIEKERHFFSCKFQIT